MHSALTHCLQRQHLHACTNGGVRTNACAHACTLNTHSCVDTRRDMRSLPASQFPSLTLNQSFLIYQRGFVSGRLMPAPIRGKKTTQQQWKSQSKSLLWCDYTHNQIRADLNRHRTQNHIKGNSMCMALHCSRSSLILSALLSFPCAISLPRFYSQSLSIHLSVPKISPLCLFSSTLSAFPMCWCTVAIATCNLGHSVCRLVCVPCVCARQTERG